MHSRDCGMEMAKAVMKSLWFIFYLQSESPGFVDFFFFFFFLNKKKDDSCAIFVDKFCYEFAVCI